APETTQNPISHSTGDCFPHSSYSRRASLRRRSRQPLSSAALPCVCVTDDDPEDLRISHKHIPPGCPEVNGKVERSHKTDSEEFYRGRHFKHKRDLARKLKKWETEYNEERPHLALKGKTPSERVRELVQPFNSVSDLSCLIQLCRLAVL